MSDSSSKTDIQHSLMVETKPCIETMTEQMLSEVITIEKSCYTNPWSLQNFKDSIGKPDYYCLVLKESPQGAIMGYMIALKGIEEVHLLNISVAPAYQKKGCALMLLETLRLWAIAEKKPWVWLEVRQSNIRAHCIYEKFGFEVVGTRRNYYPVVQGVYENAILMSLRVC